MLMCLDLIKAIGQQYHEKVDVEIYIYKSIILNWISIHFPYFLHCAFNENAECDIVRTILKYPN